MEKQNLSADEQMRRLGNRWIFDCANRLMADEGMERKAAFRQAVRAYHLLEQLGKGEVRFEYLKVNGEKRHARGTLCHGISAEFDNYEFKNDKPDVGQTDFGIIAYFDLDKNEFRCLHIRNLLISYGTDYEQLSSRSGL
jgi:hypothetical protein